MKNPLLKILPLFSVIVVSCTSSSFDSGEDKDAYEKSLSALSFTISQKQNYFPPNGYIVECYLQNTTNDTICIKTNTIYSRIQCDTALFKAYPDFSCNTCGNQLKTEVCLYPKDKYYFSIATVKLTESNKLKLTLGNFVFIKGSKLPDSTHKPELLFSKNPNEYLIHSNDIELKKEVTISDADYFRSSEEKNKYESKLSKLEFHISPSTDRNWIQKTETDKGKEISYDITCTVTNISVDTICFQKNSGNELRRNLQYDTTNFEQYFWFHCNASWPIDECLFPKKSYTFNAQIIRRTNVDKLRLALEDLVFIENSKLLDSPKKSALCFPLYPGKYIIQSNEIKLPEN